MIARHAKNPIDEYYFSRLFCKKYENANQMKLLKIADAVCKVRGLRLEDILTPKKNRQLAEARQVIMYLAYFTAQLSEREIGGYFNRDHSTVAHAKKQIGNLISTNREFSNEIDYIKLLIK